MKHGFIKVAAAAPKIRVADCIYNADAIIRCLKDCAAGGAKIIVFPELCVTGYTAGDLFCQEALLAAAQKALSKIRKASISINALFFVGLPLKAGGKLYSAAAAIQEGRILAVIPKSFLPSGNEGRSRCFSPAPSDNSIIIIDNQKAVFGTKIVLCCTDIPALAVAAELNQDLEAMIAPSVWHAGAGATVIACLAASNELAGKPQYRKSLVGGQSSKLKCAYIYSNAGEGESSSDTVFSGHSLIAESGHILAESPPFASGTVYTEIDVNLLALQRAKAAGYAVCAQGYETVEFSLNPAETVLTRAYPKLPFVPSDRLELDSRAELILTVQAQGLKKRIEHINANCIIVGVSGGLDSALALLVAARAAKLAGKDAKAVLGISMPCFGTTKRTLSNSYNLTTALGAAYKEIDITATVTAHLNYIGHTWAPDAAYENAQARERTQVLMDIANINNGLVVGTGDLSELALGWTTYNGDHMSMYGVNASIPKTLLKHLIQYEADRLGGAAKDVLLDILDTPISPELLPPKGDGIAQRTEELVGPYILHDFFIYHIIKNGFSPSKVYRLACLTFKDDYDGETVKRWLAVFIKRFFANQFKRSCLPDGIKVGSVSFSPRGDWQMPCDASPAVWLKELEEI